MSSEENKAIMRRFSEEFLNKGDMAAADELVDADYINHNPVPGQMPGLEGIKRSVAGLRTALAFREEIQDIVAEEDRVVVRAIRYGKHVGTFMGIPATGKEVVIPTMYIARFANGKIGEIWLNWDLLGLMQQIVAVRTPG